MSLYHKYRPKTLQAVLGQDKAIASLTNVLARKEDAPHVYLLSGPSGCGKTTIARILKAHFKCGDADYHEINSADFKGIDMVRDIRRHMNLSPISGDCRVWLIDESHKLTSDAQHALLKILEDTPSHVYFLLATTEPQKLIKTIHTRCTEVRLSSMDTRALSLLVSRVAEKEDLQLLGDTHDEIVEAADGSARKALVILEQVGGLKSEEEQIRAIQSTTFTKDEAISLARALMNPRHAGWTDVARILRNLKDEDAEGIRYCVLGYARSCMVGLDNKAPNMKLAKQAFVVVDVFSSNFYDSKQAGLAAACWEVVHCG